MEQNARASSALIKSNILARAGSPKLDFLSQAGPEDQPWAAKLGGPSQKGSFFPAARGDLLLPTKMGPELGCRMGVIKAPEPSTGPSQEEPTRAHCDPRSQGSFGDSK